MIKKNVLILSTSNWTSKLWFRRQHFAKRFALSGWKVLYVNPSITLLRPLGKKSGVPFSKLVEFIKDHDVETNLRVITPPPLVPLEGRYQQIMELNKKCLAAYINRKAEKFFGGEKYVAIYYNPFDVYLPLKRSYLTVYECVDEFTGYPEARNISGRIERAEKLLVKKADIVTATADSLRKSKGKWRRDIGYLPNGVDTSVFSGRDTAVVPTDIVDLPHPIIIYVGAIYEWFNLTLIENICGQRKDWNLVLIGPEKVLSNRALPENIHYLGVKDWKELPSYLKAADVSIIPFVENSLTLNVNPLKLYEYFAAGLSCVSSFMHEIKKYEEPYVLEIARTETAFIDAVERNIGKKDIQMEKKLSIAKAHSWDVIFASFERMILDCAKNPLPNNIQEKATWPTPNG